jgi:hypothetical protein
MNSKSPSMKLSWRVVDSISSTVMNSRCPGTLLEWRTIEALYEFVDPWRFLVYWYRPLEVYMSFGSLEVYEVYLRDGFFEVYL